MQKRTITMEMLEKAEQDSIIARGISIDCPAGLNMSNSGRYLRWLVKKMHGTCWTMYTHLLEKDWDCIERSGDTVTIESFIRNEIECTDEVISQYYR